jgi:PKD repeat protein
MKRITAFFFVFVLLAATGNLFAQISQGGTPLSFQLKSGITENIDNVFVNPPDMELVRAEDDMFEKNGEMYRVARLMDVDFSMENSGTWDVLADGTQIWRLSITSEDAKALSMHYDVFNLPEGSSLFLYNRNQKQVIGAFTSQNNPEGNRRFSTEIIEGEMTTLEYIQPPHVTGEASVRIFKVSYIYRGVNGLIGQYKDTKSTGWGNSEPCEVNVNCPEGNNWQTEKRGVAEIFVIDGASAGFCTGTLVNNTSEDGTPYFLSADHCGGTSTDMDMWEFYFNYEAPTCTTPGSEPDYNTVTGCTFKSRGPETGGSDFLLVELNSTPPASFGVYYNGWDISETGASSAIGIHHPAGDIKKISKSGELTTDTYTGCLANAHWRAEWVATATDHGVTEGGSSGSPIFDETSKLVVGTLTGGAASCANQTAPDFYGKMDIHWDDNGAAAADRLKPWLDPTNTGVTNLDGWDPNATSSDLAADFSANQTNIAPGTSINFTDESTGSPTSWNWTFDGGNPANSTAQNPTNINYATNGVYTVTLQVSDGTDTDTEVKTGYIVVEDDPSSLSAMFAPSLDAIAVGQCISFDDQSTGNPTSWTWTFDGATPGNSAQQNPSNICYNTPGVYDVTLAIGNGTETDTYTCNECITVGDPATDPIPGFTADNTTIPAGGLVVFTDTSINGPFVAWEWSFEGGIPETSSVQAPAPVVYMSTGTYDVEMRIEHENGTEYVLTKEDYITVLPAAEEPPVADFIANYTIILPGESVNFIDITDNGPYEWEWEFEGGTPGTSTDQHPTGITYPAEGEWTVKLIATNALGNDTITKEGYIIVSADDPCLENNDEPVAAFTATNRLLEAGETTYFQNLSTNYPASNNWYFNGGSPMTSPLGSPIDGITYDIPGIYDVSLSVSNACGVDLLTKDDYIYVFSGPVYQYCDTLSNIRGGEVPGKMNTPDTWGFIAGQNGETIRYYADYFEDYSFSQIEGLIVPVNNSVYGAYESYVKFYVWEGSTEYPDSILAEKKVYIRDMPENFNSYIEFDSPVLVNGPFYVGFKLNYPDENYDGISDDYFVVSVAPNRGPTESQNTMYVKRGSTWYTSVEYFNIATSLAIKPVACLVNIDEFDLSKDVHTYPNPTDGLMTVKLGDEYFGQAIDVSVFDLTGRKVYLQTVRTSDSEFALDFTDQTSGIYFINIQIGNEMITKKISVIR